ncbi:MAG: radical SAM protein [Pseudomonadota bacterium]|nr:radical SAM protein [Pseudomonadota bacterium]
MRRLTIVHPAIGHRRGERYIRSWQMEPLPAAVIAGLTPEDIDVRFHDDRMESIPYDEPTDAVVLSVETYTARRAYQIATEYRQRGVPVVFGGFHPTLVPDECERFAEGIVVGEAEGVWPEVIDDLRHGALRKRYQATERPSLSDIRLDRSVFAGKRYLPLGLVETGRGCRFPCDFCAIQRFFGRTHRYRPVDSVIAELTALRERVRFFFFVDDNFAGNFQAAKPLLDELAKLRIRWVTQMSINAAHDEEFLDLLARSGCKGVLIGFETLDADNLKSMGKRFNAMKGGYPQALRNLRRYGIRVYGTFIFGYDNDNLETFDETVDFALEQNLYIAAFNHLTPFPGTALYERLVLENRLRYDRWWLDDRYRYNDLPFFPRRLTPGQVTENCVAARRRFYSWKSILHRGFDKTNRGDLFMFRNFFPINLMHRGEVAQRNGYPLGDETWKGELLEAG